MSEVIVDLPYRLLDTQDREFLVSVAGEQRLDGIWEAWLEFVPLDDADVLLTPTETTQSNRAALQHWAEVLEETYVQGAFRRAVAASDEAFVSRLVARKVPVAAAPLNDVDLPDPFQLFIESPETMRERLYALSRTVLLKIIEDFGLNPGAKNLSWLSDRQLVTFIVTAVDAQVAMGRRSA